MKRTQTILLLQKYCANVFTLFLFALSALVIVGALITAGEELMQRVDTIQIILEVVNNIIIAIAIYELAMVIGEEYGETAKESVTNRLRKTLPRFIGTVSIVLALEGLIMVIKYSQNDMAGNLVYPVAIILSSSFQLIALGIYLKLTGSE